LNEQVEDSNNRYTVYHGTEQEFDDFNYKFIKEDGLFGYGFYFSQSIEVSKEEGGNNIYKCLIFDKKSNILDFRKNAEITYKILNLINKGLVSINKEPLGNNLGGYSTDQVYNYFLKPMFSSDKELSFFLLKCGIKGIKNSNNYNSLNFTVFDKNDITILKLMENQNN